MTNCEPDAEAIIVAFVEDMFERLAVVGRGLVMMSNAVYETIRPIIERYNKALLDAEYQRWLYTQRRQYMPERQTKRRHHIAKLVLKYNKEHSL